MKTKIETLKNSAYLLQQIFEKASIAGEVGLTNGLASFDFLQDFNTQIKVLEDCNWDLNVYFRKTTTYSSPLDGDQEKWHAIGEKYANEIDLIVK